MNLHKTTHTFELLTPAWAGGASPATQAEIRIPTLRGQLRQWLRLLNPRQNLDQAIFGAIPEGEAAKASLVQLRLTTSVTSNETHDLDSYRLPGNSDEGYFLWPLRPGNKRAVLMPKPASKFTLETRWFPTPEARRIRGLHCDTLQDAITAFTLLGTFGTRATRGYGSVWDPQLNLATPEELSAKLDFLPASIQVRLLDGGFRDGRAALAHAARWMRSFRIGSDGYGTATPEGRNDHDVADPAQNPKHNPEVFRQALGMPLTQRFRRQNQTQLVHSSYGRDHNDRYPSPLRIKVIRLGGSFRVLVILLRDLLLAEGTQINLSNRRTARLSHQLVNRMIADGTLIHPVER